MRTGAMVGGVAVLAWALVALAAPETEPPLDLAAEILALRDVRVPAEVAGRVTRRPENETAAVKAGEVVVALDDVFLAALSRAARASAERARARSEWTQLELRRVQTLFEKETVGEAEVDSVRLSAREAGASLVRAEALADEAERRLERTRIRAPFDGKLVRVYPEKGEYLRVGETAFRIVDDSALRIVAYVPAARAGRIAPGQEVLVATDRGDTKLPVLRAKVFSVAPAAEGAARTIRVEVRAKDATGRWRPGMTARLRSVPAAKKRAGADRQDGK